MRAVAKKTAGRAQRQKTYTDAIFEQLMEAHINSKHVVGVGDGKCPSDRITTKNFGARTGLNWPQSRVAREIVGLIGGFTRGQEDKIVLMRSEGRAVPETLSSMAEFDGTGDPGLYPFKSPQQIAAKLRDMFGDSDTKFAKTYVHQSTITPRAAVWIGRKGGNNSPSKLYVYQDGGGAVTLKTTVADVSAVTTTAKNVEKLASAGSTGSIPFPLAENYRILDRESLGETPLRAFATPTMLSSSTTGPAQQPELPAHGRALGGGGGSGDCVDIVGDDSMGGIYFSSFGGERDGGRGMEGWGYVGDTPISTGDDGLTIAMDTACCPRLPVFSTTTLKPSSRSYPSMAWPVPRYHRQEQPTRSDCEMEDNLAWNTVTGRGVPPLPSASGRHAQHRSGFGGTKPSVLQQRCGTAPPPPPARGASSLSFHANDRVREKLRIPPTPITGLALRPPTNNNDSIGESTGPLGRAFDGLRENSFGTAADRTVSLGDTASMTAGAAATTPNNGSPQEAMIFPSSVSYTDQISLRLAFGSALTQESWLSGISEFQDVESVFFD